MTIALPQFLASTPKPGRPQLSRRRPQSLDKQNKDHVTDHVTNRVVYADQSEHRSHSKEDVEANGDSPKDKKSHKESSNVEKPQRSQEKKKGKTKVSPSGAAGRKLEDKIATVSNKKIEDKRRRQEESKTKMSVSVAETKAQNNVEKSLSGSYLDKSSKSLNESLDSNRSHTRSMSRKVSVPIADCPVVVNKSVSINKKHETTTEGSTSHVTHSSAAKTDKKNKSKYTVNEIISEIHDGSGHTKSSAKKTQKQKSDAKTKSSVKAAPKNKRKSTENISQEANFSKMFKTKQSTVTTSAIEHDSNNNASPVKSKTEKKNAAQSNKKKQEKPKQTPMVSRVTRMLTAAESTNTSLKVITGRKRLSTVGVGQLLGKKDAFKKKVSRRGEPSPPTSDIEEEDEGEPDGVLGL